MTSELRALCFYANRPQQVSRFWAGVLRREIADDGLTVLPGDDIGFQLRFIPSDQPKAGQNRMHFDLTSATLDHQQETVTRALELGGRRVDVGQLPEEEHVVLGDPDGNEFCVIEPGNNFLAGCGFIGALASDGSQAVGYFWSKALGWPLVWDQNEETAIQSPRGGTKITWGGPPFAPKTGRNRLFFELTPAVDTDLQTEIDRLIELGATRVGEEQADHVLLADPDGNEFTMSWVSR